MSGGRSQCSACGEWVGEADLADPNDHDTGNEQTICLRCHREICASDSDLSCAGCEAEEGTLMTQQEREARQAERDRLAAKYPDYLARRHDAFVRRERDEREYEALHAWMRTRGIE